MKKFKAPSLNTSNLRDPFWDDRPIPAQPLTRTPASYSYSSSPFARSRTVSHAIFLNHFYVAAPHLVHCVHPRPPRLLRHVSPFSSKLSRPHPTPSFLFFSSLRCLPYDGVLSSQGRPARFHPLTSSTAPRHKFPMNPIIIFHVLTVQWFNVSTLCNKSLLGLQSCVLFSGARAHGMRTYEPRQGRKAATVVCFASAVVTLVYLYFRTRRDCPGSNQNAHR